MSIHVSSSFVLYCNGERARQSRVVGKRKRLGDEMRCEGLISVEGSAHMEALVRYEIGRSADMSS